MFAVLREAQYPSSLLCELREIRHSVTHTINAENEGLMDVDPTRFRSAARKFRVRLVLPNYDVPFAINIDVGRVRVETGTCRLFQRVAVFPDVVYC